MGAGDFVGRAADADGSAALVPLAVEDGGSAATIIVNLIGGDVKVGGADAQTARAELGELVPRLDVVCHARERREWCLKARDRVTEVVEGLDPLGVGERRHLAEVEIDAADTEQQGDQDSPRGVKRRSKGTPDRRRRGTPFSDNMMLVC